MQGPERCPNQDCLVDLRVTRVDGEPSTRAIPRLEVRPQWVCPDCGHQIGRKIFETTAHCAMSTLASRMGSTGERRSVEYADLRTSMNDWRAAFSLAIGTPPHLIDRNGYRRTIDV